jgi:LysM domain
MSKAWFMFVPLVLIISACSPHLTTSPLPSETPSASVIPTPEQTVTVADGTVGRGTLDVAHSTSTGSVSVTKAGGQYTFLLKGYTVPAAGHVLYVLTDGPLKIGDCAENNKYHFAYDTPSSSSVHKFGFFESQLSDNPSFISSFAVVKYPDNLDAPGCSQPVIAIATLRWEIPDLRPALVVADSGPSSGAQGAVTLRSGKPANYRTASGDTWSALASRFGITEDDLTYLNPVRLGGAQRSTAYADQLLNLDKGNRGNSESRRFGN